MIPEQKLQRPEVYDPDDWDEEAEDLRRSEDEDYRERQVFIGLIVFIGAVSIMTMALIFMHNTYGSATWQK